MSRKDFRVQKSKKVMTTYGLFIVMMVFSVLFCMAPGSLPCPCCAIKRKAIDDRLGGWVDAGAWQCKVSKDEVDVDKR